MKKTGKVYLKLGVVIVCVMAMTALFMMRETKAAGAGKNYLKQTDATTDSITFTYSFEEVDDYSFVLEIEDDYDGDEERDLFVTNTKQGILKLEELESATKYDICVYKTDESGIKDTVCWSQFVTLPEQFYNIPDVWMIPDKNEIMVSWTGYDAALEGCEYSLIDYRGKTIKKGTKKDNFYLKGIKPDQVYTIKLRGYMTFGGKKYYTGWSIKSCMQQANVRQVKCSGKKLKITWDKRKGASGYDIYVSTLPDIGYKKVKSVGKNSSAAVITKVDNERVSSRETYYVYVVTKKKNGKTTDMSEAVFFWNSANHSKNEIDEY